MHVGLSFFLFLFLHSVTNPSYSVLWSLFLLSFILFSVLFSFSFLSFASQLLRLLFFMRTLWNASPHALLCSSCLLLIDILESLSFLPLSLVVCALYVLLSLYAIYHCYYNAPLHTFTWLEYALNTALCSAFLYCSCCGKGCEGLRCFPLLVCLVSAVVSGPCAQRKKKRKEKTGNEMSWFLH